MDACILPGADPSPSVPCDRDHGCQGGGGHVEMHACGAKGGRSEQRRCEAEPCQDLVKGSFLYRQELGRLLADPSQPLADNYSFGKQVLLFCFLPREDKGVCAHWFGPAGDGQSVLWKHTASTS